MRVLAKVTAGLALSGAALGAIWAWMAPPMRTLTGLSKSGERVDGFLGRAADNVFVAPAMLTGLLCMLAVITAVALWQLRARRGPLMVIALWVGMTAAGAAAAGTGAALAHRRYGIPDHKGVALSPENRVAYFTEAPPVFMGHSAFQVAVALLLPAAMAVLVYALLASGTHRDDLGRDDLGATAAGTEPARRA